jgi:nucleotide-binding universal stress UspA family protein
MTEPSIRRVLCAVDVTRPALGALRHGLEIARHFRATCDAIYARDPLPQLSLATLLPRVDQLVSRLDAEERLGNLLLAEGGERASRHSIDGRPSATILARSVVTNADLVVLGWNRSEAPESNRPGVARLVASRATCAVLTVCGELPGATIRRIAVPIDFSPVTRSTLSWSVAFARHFEAHVFLIHVLPAGFPKPNRMNMAQAARRLQAAVMSLEEAGIPATGALLYSHAGTAGAILDYCHGEDFELLILGAHRTLPEEEEEVEGVVAKVRRDAGFPVLSLRPRGPRVEFSKGNGAERGNRGVGAA